MFSKIILLAMTVCFVQAQNMAEMAKILHATCKEETKVTEDLLLGAHLGSFPEDDTLKCYMKCIFTQIDAMEEDGTFNKDGILAILPKEMKEEATRMLTICEKETGANACEKAFNINKCCYKNNPKSYFLI